MKTSIKEYKEHAFRVWRSYGSLKALRANLAADETLDFNEREKLLIAIDHRMGDIIDARLFPRE